MVSAACTNGCATGPSLSDRKLSTAVPAVSSGDNRTIRLADTDLALRLHRLRLVFFFPSPAGSVPITDLKFNLFLLLTPFFPACARVRTDGSGRPFLLCNDCGVRVVETRSESPMHRWLDDHEPLAPDVVLGSDPAFSPLVAIQFTRFACGGLAVGLSWSHLLGDFAAAANFATSYFRMLSGYPAPDPISLCKPVNPALVKLPPKVVNSVRSTASECKMETLTFRVEKDKIKALTAEMAAQPFAAVCSAIWHSMMRIRDDETAAVTVVRFNGAVASRGWLFGNDLAVTVTAPLADVSLAELASAINGKAAEKVPPLDLVMYGEKLTFVDLEEVPVDEERVNGQLPVFVCCTVDGVGEAGCVVVLRGSDGRRTVHVTIPRAEVAFLKKELLPLFGLP